MTESLGRLVVLISGNGSNLQAIIDAIGNHVLPDARIDLVISNRKDAYGLQRAKEAGIPTAYHNLTGYGTRYPSNNPSVKYSQQARQVYDADLAQMILECKPDMVVCAGWMHILSDAFLEPIAAAKIDVLNLHPALPGEYDGARAIERAFDDLQNGKMNRTGLMIHYVIREVDRGTPIICQEVPMHTTDSLADLQNRIHAAEHDLILQGIALALEKRRS